PADAGDATTGADAPGGDTSSADAAGPDADADGTVPGDTGASDGLLGEGATDSSGDGANDAATCTGSTLYVSTKGADSNSGCDPAHPKLTIAGAITTAGATGATIIQVCAGTYAADSLTVSTNVVLMGGYACKTTAPWTRTATYGYPTFDTTNQTILQVATTSTTGATLTLEGSGGVDGFTIQGQATGSINTTAAAVRVTGAVSPTITNDQLLGGGTTYTGTGTDPTPASAGLVVDDGASPVVAMDLIEGGTGSTPAGEGTGSAGVYATGANGTLTIRGSTIRGGSGKNTGPSGSGSQGLLLNGSAGGVMYTVESSAVYGGTGTTGVCANGCRATRGLYLNTGTATLVVSGDSIEGGDVTANPNGSTTGTDCPHGVEVLALGSVTVTGSRIYGGRCNTTSSASGASLFGLYVSGGATLVATNNMIHMGASDIPHGGGALGLAGNTGAHVVHNTLIAGTSTSSTVASLWLQAGATGAVVDNNILAAAGGMPNSTGLLLSCAADGGPSPLASFQYNLLFGTTTGLLQWSNCNGNADFSTVDALTAQINGSFQPGTATGNVTVSASCTSDAGTDSGCRVLSGCMNQSTCLTSVFEGFDSASLGYANLFPGTLFAGTCPTASSPPSGNGWSIAATPPCAVAKSGMNDSATVTTDLYGNCRTNATMGAAEYSGACQ
ncbi:MAG: hypothetical protein ABSE49_00005, partial [Polyangiaceae bacterium]